MTTASPQPPPARPGWPAGPARRLHTPRNRTKAEVWLVGEPPGAVVVKDVASVPWWFSPIARWQLRREARAYRALDGLAGVPRLLSARGRHLVLSFVEGIPLPVLAPERLEEGLFDALDRLVAALHDRGVACGDLHHRNVLVDADGRPRLVDFALAVTGRGWLFRRLAELDRSAALRMRLRYLRRPPTPDEAARLQAGGGWWRAGRFLKRLLGAVRPRAGGVVSDHREHTR